MSGDLLLGAMSGRGFATATEQARVSKAEELLVSGRL